MHLANVGDTRAVLVSEGAPAKRLTVDHVALDPNEARRVHQAGGHVTNNRVGGILAITRALGDHTLKGDSGGVTAEPYCFVHTVDDHDRFVVMASDGVWDVMSDDDVHGMVLSASEQTVDEISERLVQSALARGSRDNLSCLVVKLR